MKIKLAERVSKVKPSPTLAVAAKAASLKAAGRDVIGLGTGEPDFDTPDNIKQAGIAAINEGYTKYTPVDGLPSLKEAVINKLKRDNGLEYHAKQILVSVGGKQSFYNLAQALLGPGDEVIIPAPYWVSYPAIVTLAGATPVIIEAGIKQQYKITAEQLSQAITAKTKLVTLNSPSNPTGQVYTKAELEALADVMKQHPDVLIATDDMYEHILWGDEPFDNILTVCPELYDQTIVLNGVSKAYAMTGWRIGYAAGPENLIAAMKKVQSQSTSNPTAIAQKAAEEALNGSQDSVKTMCEAFKERHDAVFARVSAMPNIDCIPAQGTFYLFPDVSAIIATRDDIADDVAFAEKLLEEVGVALVPGSAFGAPGCIRLSFATSMDILNDALNRLEKFIG